MIETAIKYGFPILVQVYFIPGYFQNHTLFQFCIFQRISLVKLFCIMK